MSTGDATREGTDLGARIDAVLAWSGVGAAVVAFTAILAATVLTPWFSWTDDALSELGAPTAPYSWLFNWGLIVAGVLGTAFTARIAVEGRNAAHYVGGAILVATTVFLFGIGLFEAGHPLHNPVSFAFFVSLSYGLLGYGTGDVLAGRTRTGLVSVWLATANVTGWLVWAAVYFSAYVGTYDRPGVAVPEFVGAVALAGFVVPATRRLRADRGPAWPDDDPDDGNPTGG